MRPGQVVQPSPPNPPNPPPVTSHPPGMATSVIRISPNPARGGPLSTSTISSSQQHQQQQQQHQQQQQQQHSSWRVESPGAPQYSEVPSQQQPMNSFPSVVTSASQQQHQHQQSLILQQALTSNQEVNSSTHHVEGHPQQHIRLLKPPPQHQNLTFMQMPKNEVIDCSPGSNVSSSGGSSTLYCVVPPQEKKFVVIKSEVDPDKFSATAVMMNQCRIPPASNSSSLPQSVVVDKSPVSVKELFMLKYIYDNATVMRLS